MIRVTSSDMLVTRLLEGTISEFALNQVVRYDLRSTVQAFLDDAVRAKMWVKHSTGEYQLFFEIRREDSKGRAYYRAYVFEDVGWYTVCNSIILSKVRGKSILCDSNDEANRLFKAYTDIRADIDDRQVFLHPTQQD